MKKERGEKKEERGIRIIFVGFVKTKTKSNDKFKKLTYGNR